MSLSSVEVIHPSLTSRPVHSLTEEVRGARNWMEAMQTLSSGLRGLAREDGLLPDIEANVLLDPLYGSVLGWLPDSGVIGLQSGVTGNLAGLSPSSVVRTRGPTRERWHRTESRTDSGAKKDERSSLLRARAMSQQPARLLADGGAKEDERQGLLKAHEMSQQPASLLADSGAKEGERPSLLKAREMSQQPARLLAVMQRYAGSPSPEHPATQVHPSNTIPESPSFKVKTGGMDKTTRQGYRIITLPIKRTAASALEGQRLYSLTAYPSPFAKLEARAGNKLKQWVKDGNAGIGLISKLAFQEISVISDSASEETLNTADGTAERSLPIKTTRLSNPSITGFGIAGMNRQGRREVAAGVKPPQGLLEEAVRDASIPPIGGVSKSNFFELQLGPMIQSLERMVEGLIHIETKLSEAAAASGQREKEDGPSVRWLEDEDLAGKLQRILRRQAQRRGIDLS